MFWNELAGWLLFLIKWESAVVQWKLTGRSELYASTAAIIGTCLELTLILGLLELAIRGVRILRVHLHKRRLLPKTLARVKLSGKGEPRIPKAARAIALWLTERELGIAVRYMAIFILAAMPVVPWLTFAAVAFSRATKSRYGNLFIFSGAITKVLITVHAIYSF